MSRSSAAPIVIQLHLIQLSWWETSAAGTPHGQNAGDFKSNVTAELVSHRNTLVTESAAYSVFPRLQVTRVTLCATSTGSVRGQSVFSATATKERLQAEILGEVLVHDGGGRASVEQELVAGGDEELVGTRSASNAAKPDSNKPQS